MEFDAGALLSAMPALLPAALVNIQIALVAMALSLLGGALLTILRSFKNTAFNAAVDVVISFVRGTPLLIQIFLFYYALPAIGVDLGPMTAGILAIAFNSSIFVSEIMRGGLASLDPGQIEAAAALGLRAPAIWLRVVLPQLYLRTLPTLLNEFTIVVKGTALLSVITVVELLRTAQRVSSTTFRPFETLIGAALLFLVISLVASRAGNLLETRLAVRRG